MDDARRPSFLDCARGGSISYELDNSPVEYKKLGDAAVEIVQPASTRFGFQKTLRVELLEDEVVRITHKLANTGGEALDIYPWALSVMAPGGYAIIPQPKLDLHPSRILPRAAR